MCEVSEMSEKDRLIQGGINLIMEKVEEMENEFARLLHEITDQYDNGALYLTATQFNDIIVLTGAVAQHKVQVIETQIENLYLHGKVEGEVKELINLAEKFKNLDFE